MNKKTAYIDFDGTIVNVFPRFYRIFKEYLSVKYDVQLEYNSFCEKKRRGMYEHVYAKEVFGINVNVEEYVKFKRNRLEDQEYLKEDIIIGNPKSAYLSLKKAGFFVQLLSQRRNSENLKWELEYLNLVECFDSIAVVYPIPDNAKLKYLRKIVTSEDVIIGDSTIDMDCAVVLDIEGWFVKSGLHSDEKVPSVIHRAENYNEAVMNIVGKY